MRSGRDRRLPMYNISREELDRVPGLERARTIRAVRIA